MEKTKKQHLMILIGIFVFFTILVFIFIFTFDGFDQEDMFHSKEGIEFCSENNMNFTLYLSGDRYCDDGEDLYEIKYAEGFKFVRRKE